MGLRGDFERAAQACDLHRDEVLHQLAHPLHGVFALHHDVEVEVVDQPDQQIVEFLMCTENEGETRHLVLAVTRLEVHEVDEIAHAGLERLEFLAGRHLGELPLGAARGRHEAVLQHRQDAGRGSERARGEQPGEQIGLGADRDHRLHHLHAALDQRAHGDVATLADILRGGDHLEVAVVDDRGELVADLVVCGVQRGEPCIERVANFGALRDRLLERLEVFLEPLRHRLGDGKAAGVALSDAQPVHDGIEIARTARDLRGDQLAVVGALGRHIARGRGGNLARGGREAQRVGHRRHFAGRDALEAALRLRERHDRDRGGDHRHDGDRAERGLQPHLDAEFRGFRLSVAHEEAPEKCLVESPRRTSLLRSPARCRNPHPEERGR